MASGSGNDPGIAAPPLSPLAAAPDPAVSSAAIGRPPPAVAQRALAVALFAAASPWAMRHAAKGSVAASPLATAAAVVAFIAARGATAAAPCTGALPSAACSRLHAESPSLELRLPLSPRSSSLASSADACMWIPVVSTFKKTVEPEQTLQG